MADKTRRAMIWVVAVLLIAVPVTAFSEGRFQYTVSSPLLVAGSELHPGAYDISWKAGSQEAQVTFAVRGKEPVKVQGKIVDVSPASQDDMLMVARDSDGRDAIKEIRFRGKKIKIVF